MKPNHFLFFLAGLILLGLAVIASNQTRLAITPSPGLSASSDGAAPVQALAPASRTVRL